MTVIKNDSQKEIFSRLLASENIDVVQAAVPTASFNPDTRVLTLPIFKDVSENVFDMLMGHEVGHALISPNTHNLEHFNKGRVSQKLFHYLNVIEDVRVEKHIKAKYPGLKRAFAHAYKELWDKDFFGIKQNGIQNINTDIHPIDKFNIYGKVGSLSGIQFSVEEQKVWDEIYACETFEDVMALAKRLLNEHEQQKQEQQQQQQQGGDGEGHGDDSENQESGEGQQSESQDKKGNNKKSKSDKGDDAGEEVQESGEGDDAGEEGQESGEGDDAGDDADAEGDDADGEGEGEGDDGEGDDTDADGQDADNSSSSSDKKEAGGDVNADIFTMGSLDEATRNLVDENAKQRTYADVASFTNVDAFIKGYKTIDVELKNEIGNRGVKAFKNFQSSVKPIVSHMVKEFNQKKAADESKRVSVSKTGVLNMNKLHQYKLTEDIFKRNAIVRDGKNHGFVMFLDWSGSMESTLRRTVEQVEVLAMFFRQVGVPFDLYAFQSCSANGSIGYNESTFAKVKGNALVCETKFRLLNFLSSKMTASEFARGLHHLYALSSGRKPYAYQLHSTPLEQSIVAAEQIVNRFIKENRVQKAGVIFLTDGAGDGDIRLKEGDNNSYYGDLWIKTGAKVFGNINKDKAAPLFGWLKHKTGAEIIGFYISGSTYLETKEEQNFFAKEGWIATSSEGYDEYYVIKPEGVSGFKGLSGFDFDNAEDIADKFISNAVSRKRQLKIASKFVERVA